MTLRPDPGTVPDGPGVYRFLGPDRQVLYVGKAKSLRNRLNSYFSGGLHPRTEAMVEAATSVDWTVVATEVEALQLEYSWIKEYEPRFNVKYTDDKSYPFLAVTVGEDYPRIMVMRGAKRRGVRYFGPYSHAWAIRETVDQLLRVFPARTCSKGVFRRAEMSGRPCLLGYIGKCSAPCVGRVSMAEHRAIIDEFCSFVSGDTQPHLKRVERAMREAADAQDYETAARLRDDLFALQRALERNAVVLPDRTNADVITLAADDLQGAVQVFHVRGGRITGQRGFMVERTLDLSDADLMGQALLRFYGDADPSAIPREVLIDPAPDDREIRRWLAQRAGHTVTVRRPERGDKRALMDTVRRNAEQSLVLHKRRRAGDLTARARAMEELQQALGLDSAPLRIEGYDISHLQGQDTVGSMVVFEDGLPRTGDYRRFNVSPANAGSDTDAMTEIVERRFRRYLAERHEASDVEMAVATDDDGSPVKRRGFAYPPQLLVVDGARPQAEAAARALAGLGIDDIAVCGLAKRLEEIWLPGEPDPVILSRSSEALHLLQHLRDEAHRFAIAGHRSKRGRRTRLSALDGVPGLGPAKRKALVKHFGSVRAMSTATVAEFAEVPGIGPALAQALVEHLAKETGDATPAVNLATGQVLGPGSADPVG
ncbi:MAG: excinuclease ABC subunit UvrC [Candidatus Nanopelagicales bacterium]